MFNKLATLYSNWRSRLHVQFQPQCPSRVFPEFEKDTSPYKKKKNKKYHQLVRFNPVLSRPSPGGWFGSPWVFVLSAIIALSAIQVSFPRGHFRADSADWHGEKNCDSKGHTKVVSISFSARISTFYGHVWENDETWGPIGTIVTRKSSGHLTNASPRQSIVAATFEEEHTWSCCWTIIVHLRLTLDYPFSSGKTCGH